MAISRSDKRFVACKRCGAVLVEYRPQVMIQQRIMEHLRKCPNTQPTSGKVDIMADQDWALAEESLQDVRAEEADERAEWLDERDQLQVEISAAFAELEQEIPSR
jgi:hypothetical protein